VSRYKGLFLLIAFGLMIGAYFWDALSQPVIMGERDLAIFFFPPVKLWLEALQGGEFPLWNPYTFSGQPLFGSLQTAVLYPPNWILLGFPLVFGFNLTIVLHYFLAGWFIYLLSRELGGSPGAAVLSALAFSLGGGLLSLHSVLSSLQSAVWAPLILFFLLRAIIQNSLKYVLLTMAAVLVQFLGGGIEIFLLTQALVVLLTFFPQSFLPGGQFAPFPGRLKMLGLIYGLFLGLGAVQILPFVEMLQQSARGQGLSYQQATAWSLSFADLWHLFIPDLFNRGLVFYLDDQNWLKTIYQGIIPLILIYFYFSGKDRRRVWWAALLSVSILLALGKNTPFYGLLYHLVPGINLIRFPIKFLYLAIILICLLAGLGWDALAQKLRDRGSQKLTGLKRVALFLALINALALLALVLFSAAIVETLNHSYPISYARSWGQNLHNLIRFSVGALFVFLLLAFIADRKISFRLGGGLLIGLMAADLFLGNWGQYQVFDREAYLTPGMNMQRVITDPSRIRVYSNPKVSKALPQFWGKDPLPQNFHQERFTRDYPVAHRIFNALGFPVLVYRPYQDLASLVETSPVPQATDILRLLNVKYLLWHEPVENTSFNLIRTMGIHELPEAEKKKDSAKPPPPRLIEPHFYELTQVLPRAFLAQYYRIVRTEKEMRDIFIARAFDPARTVLLNEAPQFPSADPGAPADRDAVRISEYGLNHINLEASCLGPRILFLSEVDYPGWKARVDGRPEKIYRANHAFRALPLGPGRHRIQMVYRPASFYGGLAVTGLTTVILLFWGGVRRFRVRTLKKNSRSADGPDP
jgi:hypothetical protein